MLIRLLILMFIFILVVLLVLFLGKVNSKGKQKGVPEIEEYKLKDKEIEKLSQSFVSQDEKYIASLGNGYIMNYLTNKSMQKGFAFITNKRVYFKGSCLSGTGKHLVKKDEERTVDVKNITGTGFTYHRYWGMLIALFISLLPILASTIYVYKIGGTEISKEYDLKETYEEWIDADEQALKLLKNPDLKFVSVSEVKKGRIDSKDYYTFTFVAENKQIEIMLNYVHNFGSCWNHGDKEWNVNLSIEDIKDYVIEELEYDINEEKEQMKASKEDLGFWGKILGIGTAIVLPIIIVFCIGIKNYLFKRKTLFRIEYAGGCIAFDVSFYAKAEIDDFQKQLRRTKDLVEETATIKTVTVEAPVQTPTQSSVPDDLRKYADLLKEGLISQEEYDAMKKKILGL